VRTILHSIMLTLLSKIQAKLGLIKDEKDFLVALLIEGKFLLVN
jgi:hypothetical protein